MNWFKRRKKIDPGEYYVAVDTGTEFVKCLIFKQLNNECVLLGNSAVSHQDGSMRGGMIADLPAVTASIGTAIGLAAEQAEIRPQALIMSLPGDLVRSLVTTVHYHRARPEAHLDITEIKNIAHQVQWKAYEQIRNLITNENQTGDQVDVRLINTNVIDVQIDGYKVTNPLGFQGNTITLSIFNAFAPLVHLGALQSIANALDLDLVSVAANPYAVTRILINQGELSAIVIDIGAQTTDVAVINDSGVLGIQSFAMGGLAFDRDLIGLKQSPDRIIQLKSDYLNHKLSQKLNQQLSVKFKNTALAWVKGVGIALAEFNHLDILPNRIMIAGGGSLLPEVRNALLTKAWFSHLPLTKKPYAAAIKLDHLPRMVLHNNVVITSADAVVVGLAYLTLENAIEENIVSSVVRRIVLNMQS